MSFDQPEMQPPPPPHGGQPSAAPATPEQRKRNLAQAVQSEVVAGWRVESQTDESAVLVKGGVTNHTLHLILTLITCGIWSLVWLVMVLVNQRKTVMLRVDDYGNILRTQG
ncbi:hypothetical protein [Nocardioides montaniterrae]